MLFCRKLCGYGVLQQLHDDIMWDGWEMWTKDWTHLGLCGDVGIDEALGCQGRSSLRSGNNEWTSLSGGEKNCHGVSMFEASGKNLFSRW